MRRILMLASIFGIVIKLFSQQILIPVQLRQTYDINPATIGLNENASFITRKNFSAFEGAPQLFLFSMNRLADDNMGIGVQVYSFEQGLNLNRGVKAAYSYRVYFNETSFLSFGLNLDCFQAIFRKSEYFVKHPSDPVLTEQLEEQIAIDLDAGISFNTNTLYFDLAIHQIPGRPVAFLNDFATNTRIRHYFANAGFKINVIEKFQVIPNAIFITTDNFIYRVDAGIKLLWDKSLWLGTMYRSTEAITILGGYQLNRLAFNIAWDHGLSPLYAYTTGSWEIIITYNLSKSLPKLDQ